MKSYNDVDVLTYIYYTDEHFANKKNNTLPMTFEVFNVIRKSFNRFEKFYERALKDVRRGKIDIIKNKINDIHRN